MRGLDGHSDVRRPGGPQRRDLHGHGACLCFLLYDCGTAPTRGSFLARGIGDCSWQVRGMGRLAPHTAHQGRRRRAGAPRPLRVRVEAWGCCFLICLFGVRVRGRSRDAWVSLSARDPGAILWPWASTADTSQRLGLLTKGAPFIGWGLATPLKPISIPSTSRLSPPQPPPPLLVLHLVLPPLPERLRPRQLLGNDEPPPAPRSSRPAPQRLD